MTHHQGFDLHRRPGVAQAPNFTASMEADGGGFVSQEVTFPNNHSWSPQAAADWDFPWTPEEVEQPPPEWTPKESWEPEVGYARSSSMR